MNDIKRISAGVVFESDVLRFIDRLANEQQRPRSFIINLIIRQYARMEQQKLKHLEMPVSAPAVGSGVISF